MPKTLTVTWVLLVSAADFARAYRKLLAEEEQSNDAQMQMQQEQESLILHQQMPHRRLLMDPQRREQYHQQQLKAALKTLKASMKKMLDEDDLASAIKSWSQIAEYLSYVSSVQGEDPALLKQQEIANMKSIFRIFPALLKHPTLLKQLFQRKDEGQFEVVQMLNTMYTKMERYWKHLVATGQTSYERTTAEIQKELIDSWIKLASEMESQLKAAHRQMKEKQGGQSSQGMESLEQREKSLAQAEKSLEQRTGETPSSQISGSLEQGNDGTQSLQKTQSVQGTGSLPKRERPLAETPQSLGQRTGGTQSSQVMESLERRAQLLGKRDESLGQNKGGAHSSQEIQSLRQRAQPLRTQQSLGQKQEGTQPPQVSQSLEKGKDSSAAASQGYFVALIVTLVAIIFVY